MSFQIASADALVEYLQAFTGSSSTDEIKQCIYLAELKMRNIELPALRTDPLITTAVADDQGMFPIPTDMLKPILFYQQGAYEEYQNNSPNGYTGPWIVYDRVGDRDIITLALLQQFYLWPVNIPATVHGKFGEVGNKYQLTPRVAAGTVINLYYYRAWNLLFTPLTVGWDSTLWDENSGADITETWDYGATALQSQVQMNEVLSSWPEGYIYGSLAIYYTKRHQAEDAAVYQALYQDAYKVVTDQNDLGKWSGGTTRITSIFQPRRGIGIQTK
jgi:hypothetical protein